MLEMKLFPEELQCPRWRGDRNSLETDFKFCVLSCMQMCSVCSSAQRSHCEVRYSLLLATIPHHRERWVGWAETDGQNGLQAISSSLRIRASKLSSLPLHPSSVACPFFHFVGRCDLAVFCSLDAALLSQHAKFIIVYASWQPDANGDRVCVHICTGMQQ